MSIHKEGRTLLIILLVVFIGINLAANHWLSHISGLQYAVLAVSVVLFLLVLQFFRNPKITIPLNDKHVLAPADGKVVVIEETTEDEYLKDKRLQISIFMSPLNVHVNRTPIQGVVDFFKYHPGKYLVAWHPKSSTENERTTLVLKSPSGIPVLVRQIAGAVARRIKWYAKEGQQFKQGEEFGFIKFGSRVDIFLPIGTKVLVNIDDKTKGGRTVIAELAD